MKIIKSLSLSLLFAASYACAMDTASSAPPAYDTDDALTIKDRLQIAVKDYDKNTLATLINEESALMLKDQKNTLLTANIYAVGLVGTSQKLLDALTDNEIPAPNKEFLTLLTRDILKLNGRWKTQDESTQKWSHAYPIDQLEWCLNNGADANGVTQGTDTKTPGFPYQYQQPDKTTNTHPLGVLLEVMAFPCHMKAIVEAYTLLKKNGATLSDEQSLKVLEYWQSSPLDFGPKRFIDHQMSGIIRPNVSCSLHEGSYSASECNAFNLIKAAYILLLDKKDLKINANTADAIRSALKSYPSLSNNSIQRYLKPIVQGPSDEPAKNAQPAPTSFFSNLLRRLTGAQSTSQVEPVAPTYNDLCNLSPYQEKPQYFYID